MFVLFVLSRRSPDFVKNSRVHINASQALPPWNNSACGGVINHWNWSFHIYCWCITNDNDNLASNYNIRINPLQLFKRWQKKLEKSFNLENVFHSRNAACRAGALFRARRTPGQPCFLTHFNALSKWLQPIALSSTQWDDSLGVEEAWQPWSCIWYPLGKLVQDRLSLVFMFVDSHGKSRLQSNIIHCKEKELSQDCHSTATNF